MLRTILAFIFLNITLFSFGTSVSSNGTGGGSWDDPNSWNPAAVPGCVDTIHILAGDIIDIDTHQDYESCGPIYIILDGGINFPDNGPKLRLPCGSEITSTGTGTITAPGGDNSNKIYICETSVWESKDDDLSGSFTLSVGLLPVTLVNFEINLNFDDEVEISWSTAGEINNDYFTIERSSNGLTFEEIATINGNGNSNVQIDYNFIDDSPLSGNSYYRLKQVDFDGKTTYFDILAINYAKNENGTCILKVYPNPCYSTCNIALEDCPLDESEVEINVYDVNGNQITSKVAPSKNTNGISFHIDTKNNLAPGIYIVRSRSKQNNQSNKLIVK